MAFGHGKVILLGEHGVVYGRPALAGSLERGVQAEASREEADVLEISPWDVRVGPGDDDLLAKAFAAVLEGYPGDRPRFRVRATVGLPGAAGLGCSAALGVAVVGALDEQLGVRRSTEELAEASLVWERVFHGNPSGVDNAMAAGAGLALFRRGEPLEPVRARRPLKLVVGHSGEAGSTKELVANVARQHEAEPERLEQVFDGMASLVRNAKLAIEAGDMAAVGKLMDLNQALLSSIMVSTSRLEDLCAAARAAGALGAKLTGAGGGGCMIALAADEPQAEAIRDALSKDMGADAFLAEAGT